MYSIFPQDITTTKHNYVGQVELLEYTIINTDSILVMGEFPKRRGEQSPQESKLLPIIRTVVHSLQFS
jgi:hypothetical protein